jgi:hypothetical protein
MIMASISSVYANPGSVRAIYWQRLSFFRHAVGCRSEIRLFATRRLSLQ